MNTSENGTIRVATYIRVSTQEQAQEGTSLDFQESQLTAYCQLQKWTIINSYSDPGFSGKDGERPGLQRLLADAKIGLFEKVIVSRLDRLARNLRLLLEIEQELRACGAAIASLKESIDTSTGTGKMVFQMFGMIAEWERETIIERTKSGRLQRYRDGCWACGKAAYGYVYNKATKKLAINEMEARVVRRIFNEYREGKTLYAICQGMNSERIPGRTKRCKGWRQTAIRDMLLNPMYKGTLIVNRNAHISDINKIDLTKVIRINVPAIIEEQVWQIDQDRLRNNKHNRPGTQEDYLLQGMITCGICGLAYRAERVHGTKYYLCRGRMASRHLDGSPRCQSPCFRGDWLENEVWVRIEEILNDPDRLYAVIQDTIENLRLKEADLSARIRPLDERLTEIAAQKAKLADDWVIRHMNSAKFNELKDNLDKEERRIRDLRAQIDPAQIADLESTRGVLRFWEKQIKSMAWNTENEDGGMARSINKPHQYALTVVGFEEKELSKTLGFPASKRELLDKLQLKLVVFDDRIEVNGLFPIQPIGIQSFASTTGEGEVCDKFCFLFSRTRIKI